MPIEILMPALSPTMTEGNLARWLKKEGDSVEAGEVIAEIETDKATMEVEAVDEGTIGKILVSEGAQEVKVNAVIALLLEDGEDASALEGYEVSEAAAAPAAAEEATAVEDNVVALAPGSAAVAPAQQSTGTGGRVFASPLAKRIASDKGVDLNRVQGTGPHGRIIRADVEEASTSGGTAAAPVFTGGSFGRVSPETQQIPNNNMRKVIAKRLLESKQTVPHFYLTIECEIDALLAARKQLNDTAAKAVESSETKPAYKISVNDFVIRATALALRDVPAANASWSDEAIIQYNNVDISVAVALDGGLITPVLRNADQKPLSLLSNEMKDLAKRARDGKLMPEEFQGGGFSISNLGMYGIKQFNAIINPPQSCILAVGAGEERVVKRNGEFATVNVMTVTLSSDHRVVDGAVGAEFLQAFKRYLESPLAMMV